MTSSWALSFGAAWGDSWGPLSVAVSFPFFGEGLDLNRLYPFAASPNQAFDGGRLNDPLKEGFKTTGFQLASGVPVFDGGYVNQAFEHVIYAKVLKDNLASGPIQSVTANTPLEGPVTAKPLQGTGKNRPYKKPKTQNLRIL